MNFERFGRWLINVGWCITVFFGIEFVLQFNNLSLGSIPMAQTTAIVGGFGGTLIALMGVLCRAFVNRVNPS